MRGFSGAALVALAAGGIGAWANAHRPSREIARPRSTVGTSPGGVHPGLVQAAFSPAPGDSLIGFSGGCFWGSEEAFREMPGIVATAVGYTGGSSTFPTYEQAHATGHTETVLVEFNPKVTPFSKLLATFWTLHRATSSSAPVNEKSPYRAAVWTYAPWELTEARKSCAALEAKEHRKFQVRIQPAQPFYLAEEYHQQYDEKSGTNACPVER